MRLLPTLLLFFAAILPAAASDEDDVIAAVQKIFDGMAAHDAAIIRSAMLPDARLNSIRDTNAPASMPAEDFAARIAAAQGALVERFTEKPRVFIRGRMAVLWSEYEFLRDGKFNHCGVDTATLFKTPEGWKVASLGYTTETTGCKGH